MENYKETINEKI
jgi:phosphopantothenoylcysteine decarboxylase